jgi:hypothetical protein
MAVAAIFARRCNHTHTGRCSCAVQLSTTSELATASEPASDLVRLGAACRVVFRSQPLRECHLGNGCKNGMAEYKTRQTLVHAEVIADEDRKDRHVLGERHAF